MEHELPPAAPPPSPGTRIVNVFAAPSEAFDGIAALPSKKGLWLLPFLVMIALAVLSALLVMSDESIRGQILDAQLAALEQRVADGRMTQEQFNQAQQQMEGMGSMFIVIGTIGAAVVVPVLFFAASLVLWLAMKLVLKSKEQYGTALAVYGLSSWIGILGGIVGLLLTLGLGSLYAGPNLALIAVSEFSPTNFTHVALGKIDVFGLWQTVVIGFGLSRISGKSTGTGVGIALGLWVLWVAAQLGWFVLTT